MAVNASSIVLLRILVFCANSYAIGPSDAIRQRAEESGEDLVFNALAHPVRRQILVQLAVLGGELPSGYLAKRFHHSWPTTTRHLGVLEEAGLVTVHRTGRTRLYRLDRERVSGVVRAWLAHLEPYDSTQTWTSAGRKTTR